MMTTKLRSWRQKIKLHPVIATSVFVGSALGVALIVVILGYSLNWHWTGLVSETSEPKQHAKTLWDWLNLLGVLAIPVAVGLGTAWFAKKQGQVSEAENKDNQREAALQSYIDKISELLLEKRLRESQPDDELQTIARVRTLTTLARLDEERQRNILQFLQEAKLILKDKSIISLSGAWMEGIYLHGMKLDKANLSGIIMDTADLSEAGLSEADLSGTDLSFANLHKTNLHGADLSEAILFIANLSEADLSGANLCKARVTQKQLDKAHTLKGATMPDGSIHP